MTRVAASLFTLRWFVGLTCRAVPVFAFLVSLHLPAALISAHAAAQTQPAADPEALLRLGQLYYEGRVVSLDLERAYDYYAQAAAAGSMAGKIRIGAMTARGEGVPRDVERGRKLVQELADGGSAEALLVLGELYSRGDGGAMNAKKAIDFYKTAAALGNSTAMVRLGEIYFYGRFSAPSARRALTYFQQASKAGNPWGQFGVGVVYATESVPKAGSRKEGIALLGKAAQSGVSEAIGAISDSYFFRKNAIADVKGGLGSLLKAHKAGDIDAALELIAVYRDGKRDGDRFVVPRNRAKARAILDQVKDNLEPSEAAYQEFLLSAAAAKPSSFEALKAQVDNLPLSQRKSAFRGMLRVNQALYFYLVQSRLAQLGLYAGKQTGTANVKTIRAMAKYCKPRGTPYFCGQGPASGQFAELLSYSLGKQE